ncbi:MAG: efflux RND transporter periplasmic adaptor subunit [Gemmatales bacterium]|nr:efflux RND transporter periplasmic adaptor subunit [Gemmatales bacterium]MDW8222593.1 efflux RND transporter periplasmic adaptor subunit [Gemmatales bacterium]
MRRRAWLWTIGLLVGLGVLALWLGGVCGWWDAAARSGETSEGVKQSADWTDPPLAVVQKRLWPRILRIQGNLVEAEEALVGTEVAGRVARVLVDIGSPVEQNQVLVELDAEDYRLQERLAEAQVQAIRARLGLHAHQPESSLKPENAPPVVQERALVDEARLALERATVLHRLNRNAISPEELDRLQAALKVAEARYLSALNQVREQLALLQLRKVELEQARKQLRDTSLRAPFAGVVQSRPPAPGTYLRVGDAVVRLVRLDTLRFRGKVPDRYTLQLRTGLEVRVLVEGMVEPFHTQVSRIEPSLDPATLMRIIEADIPNPDARLPANTFAEAELVLDPQAQALVVPRSAVWEFAGVERVWKLERDYLVEQRIRVGETRGEWAEIVEGLAEGDRVLVEARRGHAGQRVLVGMP